MFEKNAQNAKSSQAGAEKCLEKNRLCLTASQTTLQSIEALAEWIDKDLARLETDHRTFVTNSSEKKALRSGR